MLSLVYCNGQLKYFWGPKRNYSELNSIACFVFVSLLNLESRLGGILL